MKNSAENPYQVGLAPSPTGGANYDSQYYSIKKDQEIAGKAPDELPYPLETVVDELGNIFVKMLDIKSRFNQAKTASKKAKKIEEIENEIDDINQQIFSLTNRLYDIKLSND